jgi:hypothetical protein
MSSVHVSPSVVEFTEGREKAQRLIAEVLNQAEWILVESGTHREQLSHSLSDLGARFWDRLKLDPVAVDVLSGCLAGIAVGLRPRIECYRCGSDRNGCTCCPQHRLDDEPGDGCGRCGVQA